MTSSVTDHVPVVRVHSLLLVGLACVLLAAATAVALAWAVRPFTTGSVGPDAAAPVIHFEHLLNRDPIREGLTQTAKPLLTVLYGPLHAMADWQGVALAAVASAALCVALGSLLAFRAAGPVAAGFVAVAAGAIMRLIGEKLEAMITRILGVILAALAAQFIIDGIKQSFPGL